MFSFSHILKSVHFDTQNNLLSCTTEFFDMLKKFITGTPKLADVKYVNTESSKEILR